MISTHILDTSLGVPAQGVKVLLEKLSGSSWQTISQEQTNVDGRISFSCPQVAATYRLTFEIDNYFKKNGVTPFFVSAPVIFSVIDTNRKYHVPLLLNPYGYSTYRGS